MIKKPFRMSRHDLKARPIYHHERKLHRSPPDRRRRARQPLDRAGPDRPLPDHPDSGRRPHHRRRRTLPRDLRDASTASTGTQLRTNLPQLRSGRRGRVRAVVVVEPLGQLVVEQLGAVDHDAVQQPAEPPGLDPVRPPRLAVEPRRSGLDAAVGDLVPADGQPPGRRSCSVRVRSPKSPWSSETPDVKRCPSALDTPHARCDKPGEAGRNRLKPAAASALLLLASRPGFLVAR
jgi:hypothetical protein